MGKLVGLRDRRVKTVAADLALRIVAVADLLSDKSPDAVSKARLRAQLIQEGQYALDLRQRQVRRKQPARWTAFDQTLIAELREVALLAMADALAILEQQSPPPEPPPPVDGARIRIPEIRRRPSLRQPNSQGN